MPGRPMAARRVVVLVAPVFLAGGCGAATVPAGDVAARVEEQLEREVGVRPDVSCPRDLVAEVGTDMRCSLTVADEPAPYGVRVSVAAVDGEDVELDVEVDTEPAT